MVDYSVITLRELTGVHWDIGDLQRSVQLDFGEARFDVAKNTRAPFAVVVDTRTVVAVGTTFWVKKTGPSEGRVEVYEGSVDLVVEHAPLVRVRAGQVAEFEKGLIRLRPTGKLIPLASHPIAADVLLIFQDNGLRAAARELNRYNPRRQIVVDPFVPDEAVAGRFPANNPIGFASQAVLTWGLKYSIMRDARSGVETIHLSVGGEKRPL